MTELFCPNCHKQLTDSIAADAWNETDRTGTHRTILYKCPCGCDTIVTMYGRDREITNYELNRNMEAYNDRLIGERTYHVWFEDGGEGSISNVPYHSLDFIGGFDDSLEGNEHLRDMRIGDVERWCDVVVQRASNKRPRNVLFRRLGR